MSLPAIFGTTLDTVPADVPYLSADPALVECWQERLKDYRGARIGVCWRGNPQNLRDRWRSIPRSYFDELSQLSDAHFFSLQKGSNVRPPPFESSSSSDDSGLRWEVESASLDDTAAAMQTLDLVITCDTSLAHLAGALGVRAWVALDFAADWRWLFDREDSPWYPTLRLFRQTTPGDWQEVFGRIRNALAGFIETHRQRIA